MDGEVIVLQAGDPWLTTSSLRTIGIFSDEEHFTEFTDKMLEKGIISDWGYKSLTGYYGMGRQCDIKNGALLVSKEPVNPSIDSVDL